MLLRRGKSGVAVVKLENGTKQRNSQGMQRTTSRLVPSLPKIGPRCVHRRSRFSSGSSVYCITRISDFELFYKNLTLALANHFHQIIHHEARIFVATMLLNLIY